MISAREARENVINYEIERRQMILEKVNKLFPIISKNIEYMSKKGYHEITLYIYRELPLDEKEIAAKIITTELKENGYTITKNDWDNDNLSFKW